MEALPNPQFTFSFLSFLGINRSVWLSVHVYKALQALYVFSFLYSQSKLCKEKTPLKQYVLWALCFSKTLTELLFYYSLLLLHFGGLALLFMLKWMVSMLTFELSLCSFPVVQTCLFCCSPDVLLNIHYIIEVPLSFWYRVISYTPALFCVSVHYCLCVNSLWKIPFWNASIKWPNLMVTFSVQKMAKWPSSMNAQNELLLLSYGLWLQHSWQPFFQSFSDT